LHPALAVDRSTCARTPFADIGRKLITKWDTGHWPGTQGLSRIGQCLSAFGDVVTLHRAEARDSDDVYSFAGLADANGDLDPLVRRNSAA
jgi:hypothetical protein